MNDRKSVVAGLLATCSIAPFIATRASGGEAQELVVYAAASLREVFQNVALTFEKHHPNLKVRFNFAGSQDLRVQIEQGAKVDVFASADWKHMKLLATQNLVSEPAVLRAICRSWSCPRTIRPRCAVLPICPRSRIW